MLPSGFGLGRGLLQSMSNILLLELGVPTGRQFEAHDVAAQLLLCAFDAPLVRSVCIESVVGRVLAREARFLHLKRAKMSKEYGCLP